MKSYDPITHMIFHGPLVLTSAARQLGISPSLTMDSPLLSWGNLFNAWGTDQLAMSSRVLSTTRIGYESVKHTGIEGYDCVPDFSGRQFNTFIDYCLLEFDFLFVVRERLNIEYDERVTNAIERISKLQDQASMIDWLVVISMMTPNNFLFLDTITPPPELLFDTSEIHHG